MNIRIKYIQTSVGIIVLLSIVLLLFYNSLRYNNVFPYVSMEEGALSMLRNLLPCLLLSSLNYFISFSLWNKLGKVPHWAVKMLIDAILSVTALMIVNWLFLFAARPFDPTITVDTAGTMLFDIIIFMGVEIAYYVEKSYKMQLKREAAKAELLTYKYNLLNAQVNPHFLFNSLNNLLSLIRIDSDGAYEFTRHLTRLYRHVVNVRNCSKITLAEELDFMNCYIYVLSIRYNNSLSVDLEGEENISGHNILPLVLQMLVENIAKHNEISVYHPMTISIRIEESSITVSNPIRPRCSNVASGSFGLNYIRECYHIQGGNMNWVNDGHTFSVTLTYLD